MLDRAWEGLGGGQYAGVSAHFKYSEIKNKLKLNYQEINKSGSEGGDDGID